MFSRNFNRGLNLYKFHITGIHVAVLRKGTTVNARMASSGAGSGGTFQPIKEKQTQNQPGYDIQ